MSNRVKNADQPWCVYAHYDGNDLVYIGSGTLQRAFEFNKDKRSPDHYNWFCIKLLHRATDFIKVIEITDDYEEARFIEGRLIAEFKPKFNKTLNKLTFKDLKETLNKMDNGRSLRKCAKDLGIQHNNLRVLLQLPYCNKEYKYYL